MDNAEVAELADALVSEASDASHEGSTPSFRTTFTPVLIIIPLFRGLLVEIEGGLF